MEGGFPFGMFGDPGDMQKHLQEMAEQMQAAQKVGWADNAINLAVQMTVACINRLDLAGKPEEQAAQVRDAIRVLFPEAVMLVREAREGLNLALPRARHVSLAGHAARRSPPERHEHFLVPVRPGRRSGSRALALDGGSSDHPR